MAPHSAMPRLQSTRLCWPLAPAPKGREKEATHLIAWLGYYEPKVEISPSKAHKSVLFQIFCSKPIIDEHQMNAFLLSREAARFATPCPAAGG